MKKRNLPFTLGIMIVLTFCVYGFVVFKRMPKPAQNKSGFAVIELFTSEGCSSCPDAENVIAGIESKNLADVYILSYHVDYWDRNGWKDVFSKAEFSARQRDYASRLSVSSVYTPQVIVNGSTEFVGSDQNKLNNTISRYLHGKISNDISISTEHSNDITLGVNYTIDEKEAVLLNIALVQPEATTVVKSGENGGRTLHHVNVVRSLKTIEAKGNGSIVIDIPQQISGTRFQVIAFTQSKNNFNLLGADKINVGL